MCVFLAGDGGTLFYFPLKQFSHSQGILMHWVLYGTINLKNEPVEYGSFFQNIWIGRKEYISFLFKAIRPFFPKYTASGLWLHQKCEPVVDLLMPFCHFLAEYL